MKHLVIVAVWLLPAFGFGQMPIDTTEVVAIGGIRQFISIEGKDRSLPLLLFLHGGPGGSVMSYADRFTGKLKEHFVVVQWDQRETGRTLELNASPLPLSLELFQRDTHQLIVALLKRFHHEKLYLAGHSWGTALGFHIARSYPELLYAYMPIGPMINQRESEQMALTLMKEKAAKKGHSIAVKELEQVKIPFENGQQLYYHRKWLQELSGRRPTLGREYVEQWATRWLAVFNEASKDNLFETLPEIGCPVYFFLGRKDYQTNSTIAEKYFLQLKAPRKELFWFNTGHSIPSSDPQRLQELIIGNVLPQTFTFRVVRGE